MLCKRATRSDNSVHPYRTLVYCVEMAERIEMAFGTWASYEEHRKLKNRRGAYSHWEI